MYKTERSRDLTRNRIATRTISENSVRGRAEDTKEPVEIEELRR